MQFLFRFASEFKQEITNHFHICPVLNALGFLFGWWTPHHPLTFEVFFSCKMALVPKSPFCLCVCVDIVSFHYFCYSNPFHFVIDRTVFASIDETNTSHLLFEEGAWLCFPWRWLPVATTKTHQTKHTITNSTYCCVLVRLIMLKPSSAGKMSHLSIFNSNRLYWIQVHLISVFRIRVNWLV